MEDSQTSGAQKTFSVRLLLALLRLIVFNNSKEDDRKDINAQTSNNLDG
jgi:hypothetical protein